MSQVLERIEADRPKKILACDGGGILGLMSVEILAKIEADLRDKTGKPELVLADWFDFVCGTSTGAIIATCISLGMSTAQIRDFYLKSGPLMSEKARITQRLRYAYTDEPLAKLLRQQINRAVGRDENDAPATLGDDGLRTVLMMVMRNHTTDSPWPVSNNPNARYNDRGRPDCNLNLPLWKLVRASTAAPTFFPPEVVVFGANSAREYSFVFVDGGVTTYNNPAFLAFQMATARPYGMNWKTGTDQLLIVSIGTGSAPRARPDLSPDDLWLLDHAKSMPSALMNAASAGWDMACRTVGECRFGGHIDNEFGSGMEPQQSTIPKQFAYVRYDPDVTAKGLSDLGLGDDIKPENVQVMDSVEYVKDIGRVGEAFARGKVSLQHFKNF
jgi:patatin-like phospholipase/acyl hydrolase